MPAQVSSLWLREISDDMLDVMLNYSSAQSPVTFVEIRHAGGAIARVKPDTNAYGNRDANHILEIGAITPTPEIHKAAVEYIKLFKQALQPYSNGRVYINFLEGAEKWEQTKNAYSPENYERLRVLKAKYDANDRFRFSFNIPAADKENNSGVLESKPKLSNN
jgi:hypothetical protein